MKPIRYKKPSKLPSHTTHKTCGVYLVSGRNEKGEPTYNFVSLNPHGRWLLDNVHSHNLSHVGGLGKVVASYQGKSPIQRLKQQMFEANA